MEKMVFELTLDTNFWGSPVGQKMASTELRTYWGDVKQWLWKLYLFKKLEDYFVKLLKLSIYTY